MDNEPLTLLARALDQVGEVLSEIRADQEHLSSPCRSWTVAQLGDHVVHDLGQFRLTATGGKADWSAEAAVVPAAERPSIFRSRAADLLDAWRAAGDLTGTVTFPGMGEVPARFPVDLQTAEFAVHAWDLARATGQSTNLDPEVGQLALDWMRGTLVPQFRGPESEGKSFGPEVPISAEAHLYDRLAAFAGREVHQA
ncbi:TIGR03086 family protein [Asanoa hainanensis]|uniref:TIGR03086 family protein n=1 Tax=Asanoa hainanensis TaxID=560556 RepID=A0A239J3R2_9ACTN|nr:TIGR03086 family metal-binding protein [Asanoa hainanensis]SNT00450.1 TIGR03086 family protein [Asanoa hainanensis]